MTKTMTEQRLIRIQMSALVIGAILLLAKFTAYFLSHSNTILTDALESIINVLGGAFALYSLYFSAKPKDADHPYGHGKVEFVSAGLEGIMIIMAGVLIIGKTIFSFFHPVELADLDIGLAIIVVSGIVNYIVGFWLEWEGDKHNSMALIADGRHLKSDAYSSLAILIGLCLIIFTRYNFLDNVVAILMGLFIFITGVRLTRKSFARIMDEADEKTIQAIIDLLEQNRKREWIDVHNLRIIQYGNKLHVDCHVTMPWYFTLEEGHREVEEIARLINSKYSAQVEFFIHSDPCLPTSCKICTIDDCVVRQYPFQKKLVWTMENVLQNKRHTL